MGTNRPSPIIPIHAEHVAYGYPVDPPPPLSTTGGASLDYDKRVLELKRALWGLVASTVGLVVFFIVLYTTSKTKLPRFQLDSVSVVNRSNTTAVWEIGFSVDKSLADLSVWVHYMARDYKVVTVGMAGNATVSVATSSPPGAELAVLEKVTFRCNNYKDKLLEAACKDVIVVGFSSSTPTPTPGVMQGGPRLCPIVNHDRDSD